MAEFNTVPWLFPDGGVNPKVRERNQTENSNSGQKR
jgi:hypothetical protein